MGLTRDLSRPGVLDGVGESAREVAQHLLRTGARALAGQELMVAYSWPGNVRELRDVGERARVLTRGADAIGPENLPERVRAPGARPADRLDYEVLTLEEVERRHIERTLYLAGGNRTASAEKLGIARATLHEKTKRYKLEDVGC